MQKTAICPYCGTKVPVRDDQWLKKPVNTGRFVLLGNLHGWIGYKTWFYHDCGDKRAYVSKWYDSEYKFICWTAYHMVN